MKTYIKKTTLLLLALIAFSCSKDDKEEPGETLTNGQVYVSGFINTGSGDITKLWIDGIENTVSNELNYPLPLLETKLNDLFVENQDVYIAGFELVDSKNVAAYWKNGVKTQLGDLSTNSKAKSIFVKNGSVFVVGTEFSGISTDAVLWRDGVKTILLEGVSQFRSASANSVFVNANNDVIVVGNEFQFAISTVQLKAWKNGIELFDFPDHSLANAVFASNGNNYIAAVDDSGLKDVAVVWKDSIATPLTDGTNRARANDVYVSGNDVYVVGLEAGDANDRILVWKNGVSTPITTGTNLAGAYSIYVSENDVYVSGYEWNGNKRVATIWKNGIATPLTDGTQSSIAYDVFVKEN